MPYNNSKLWLLALTGAVVAALAGCQTAPPAPPPAPPPVTEVASEPVVEAAPAPPAPPPPLTAAQRRQALDAARSLLDQGESDKARVELEAIVAADPAHRAARTLLRSMSEDPMALHGRDSFAYRVVAGDTLALVAQRFLNDRDLFWSLARYNQLKVPRQLRAGQVLRIPGKALPRVMPAAAADAAGPGALAAAAGAASMVPAVADADLLSEVEAEAEAERAERDRRAFVDRRLREARTAAARKDACAALQAWDQVLRVEPFQREALQQREAAQKSLQGKRTC